MEQAQDAAANPRGAAGNIEQADPLRKQFRERARARLEAERIGAVPAGPPTGYAEAAQEAGAESDEDGTDGYGDAFDPASQASGQPEAGEQEPTPAPEEAEAAPEDSDTGDEEIVADADPDSLWRERAEKAEEARASMERDYRIKTSKIANAVREITAIGEPLQAEAAFYAELAEANVNQFNQVNWDALRTEPQKYSQAKRQYEAALIQRNQLVAKRDQIRQHFADKHAKALDEQAQVSQDILRTTIGDQWGEEYYGTLAKFAAESYGYSPEEFADIVDWRQIMPIHHAYQAANAPKVVRKVVRQQGKPPAQAQREKSQQRRNAAGQFATSRQSLYENPGDPRARREFFQNKLAAERRR